MKEVNKMRDYMKQLDDLEKKAAQLHKDNQANLFGAVFGLLFALLSVACVVLVVVVGR